MYLDITETDESFGEAEIESQVNLSQLIPFAPCLK